MLNINKTVSLYGSSVYDDVTVATYNVTVDTTNFTVQPSAYIQNMDAYLKHREECNEERKTFEDMAFTEYEKLVAEKPELGDTAQKQE